MMGKLYPPYLEGTLPAFCDAKEGTVLTVPFSMNRAVNKKEVTGFYLKMKNIQSDKYFASINSTSYDLEKQEIYFDLTSIKKELKIGQFYKVQIAYIGTDATVGYYSSVGVIKYTSRPKVYIEKLNHKIPNNHLYSYLGCYSQEIEDDNLQEEKDYSEKVFQYRFVITDKTNGIIADTNWQLHNNSNDINSYESQDNFIYTADFEKNKNYYIQYMVRTNNGLEIESHKYRIVSRGSIEPDVDTKPKPVLNFDYGYVDIWLDPSKYEEWIISHYEENPETGEKNPVKEKIEKAVSGSFVLSRKIENGPWEELYRFALMGKKLSSWHWKDFTVEQGKTYTYAIQEYNDYGLYSKKKISNPIYIDFEDAFLFDGKRQLRIRFNPKISSFKTNFLESKIDTIGSKHPFIFRNGNVSYKEFPISGLISYQMDEANLFGFDEDFVLTEKFTRENYGGTPSKKLEEYKVKTTNLVGYNFSAERDFKLEVLDWLNNGQPKLFRSPSEGNYIVRLLNTSLSPEDTINRLIHTFNSTAYEVAEYTYENLNKYGFISTSEPDTTQLRWMTIELLKECVKEENKNATRIELIQHPQATSVFFYDMRPGDMVYVNNKSIVIGATGSYFIDNGEIIESIQIPGGVVYQGRVTYSFTDNAKNTFDAIESVSIKDIAAHQFIGAYDNILDNIQDIKTIVSNFYYLDFQKREVFKAYVKLDENQQYKISNNSVELYAKGKLTPFGEEEYLIARQKIIDDFIISKNHIKDYYKYSDLDMMNRAYAALQFEIQDKYFYQPLAEYVVLCENGLITPEQYYAFEQKLYEDNYDLIISEMEKISIQDIMDYIQFLKKEAIINAEEKKNIRFQILASPVLYPIGDGDLIKEDPFRLFQYDLPYLTVDTTHGVMTISGFEKIKITEEDFLLEQQYLIDRYYVLNAEGDHIPITTYDSELLEKDKDGNEYCYIKKPFEMYYDPKQPTTMIIAEDSLNRINEFLRIKKELVYSETVSLMTSFKLYSNKIYIDEEELDLTDDIQIKINSLTEFKTIKMDSGVLLNCGYEVQILKYYNEDEVIENYKQVENLQKILNTTYKDSYEKFYIDLLIETELSEYLKALAPNTDIEYSASEFYAETIQKAHLEYEIEYAKYLDSLIKILIEREVIVRE